MAYWAISTSFTNSVFGVAGEKPLHAVRVRTGESRAKGEGGAGRVEVKDGCSGRGDRGKGIEPSS